MWDKEKQLASRGFRACAMKIGNLADLAKNAPTGQPAVRPASVPVTGSPTAKSSSPSVPSWSPTSHGMKWIVIESKLLDGEVVLVVFEKRWLKEARQKHPGKVIYFPPEVDELARFKDDPQTVKLLHRIKKEFGGWIVPSNSPKANAILKGGKRHERR